MKSSYDSSLDHAKIKTVSEGLNCVFDKAEYMEQHSNSDEQVSEEEDVKINQETSDDEVTAAKKHSAPRVETSAGDQNLLMSWAGQLPEKNIKKRRG